MMKRSLTCLRVLSLCLALSLFSHCAHVGQALGLIPEKPDIELARVSVNSVTLAQVSVDVVVSVLNRDRRKVSVERLDFDLIYGDASIGRGGVDGGFEIEPLGTKDVTVPLRLQTGKLLGAAVDVMSGAPMDDARVRGSGTLRTWLGSIEIPFDRKLKKQK